MDFPRIYSLSPYTLEEVVSRNFLIGEKPDAIINIIDGTNLERNLYLTTQLTELGIPVIIAVNMMDLVRKNGEELNVERLAKDTGCKVVEISALKSEGIDQLAQRAVAIAKSGKKNQPAHRFEGCVEHAIAHFGEWIISGAQSALESIGCAPWLTGLLVDGIISGVGAVLGFVPQMLVLFLFLAFLEGYGYMARIAFIMDRIFRKFGLSGKSFIPMLIGAGCAVPGVMASRTIENDRDSKMKIMTTTFIPCGAKRRSLHLSQVHCSTERHGWRRAHISLVSQQSSALVSS